MSNETTLQELALSRAALQIVCRRCRHGALKFPMELAPRVGWTSKVAQVARHHRNTDNETPCILPGLLTPSIVGVALGKSKFMPELSPCAASARDDLLVCRNFGRRIRADSLQGDCSIWRGSFGRRG